MSNVSNWFSPLSITQNLSEAPPAITWQDDWGELNSFPISITQDLTHFANSGGPGPAMTDIRQKTTMLTFSNFNITMSTIPDTITGIEMMLNIQRNGRVADCDIFLSYQGNNLGLTQVNWSQDETGHLIYFNVNDYGGDGNLWGLESIDPSILLDPTFGINLRLQSHPFYPHRCGCRIYGMTLRYFFT